MILNLTSYIKHPCLYHLLLLLQKNSHFQNIPFVNLFHPESNALTIILTNFWLNSQINIYLSQLLFYWNHSFVEQNPIALWRSELGRTQRRIQIKTIKSFRRKTFSRHDKPILVKNPSTTFTHPFFGSYRKLFTKKTSYFSRFWKQRRHRARRFIQSKSKLPNSRLVQMGRKKRGGFKSRKFKKVFWIHFKKFIAKVKSSLRRKGGARKLGRVRIIRFINSFHFRCIVLPKLYRSVLRCLNTQPFLINKGVNQINPSSILSQEPAFTKTVVLAIRRYIFLSLLRTKPNTNTRLIRTSQAFSRSKHLKHKESTPSYGYTDRSQNLFVDSRTTPFFFGKHATPNPFANNLRKMTSILLLNRTLVNPLVTNFDLENSYKFRTLRGHRWRAPRLPRMTNYFSLRARRSPIGLLTPLFVALLKDLRRVRKKKTPSPAQFNPIADLRLRRRLNRGVIANKRLKNTLFWGNKLLKKKILHTRRIKKNFVWRKKNFRLKPKFCRAFKHFSKTAFFKKKLSNKLSLRRQVLLNFYLRNETRRRNQHIFTRLPSPKTNLLTSQTFYRSWIERRLPAIHFNFKQLSLYAPEKLRLIGVKSDVILSRRYFNLRHRWRRQKQSPRWRRFRRSWYILKSKFLKKLEKPSKKFFVLRNLRLPIVNIQISTPRKLYPKTRVFLVRRPYQPKRESKLLKNLFRRLFHNCVERSSGSSIRKVSRRRRYRRWRKRKSRRLNILFWNPLSKVISLNYIQPILSIPDSWYSNLYISQMKVNLISQKPQSTLFTKKFLFLGELDRGFRKHELNPNFKSLVKKTFILSELGFLYLKPFNLVLNSRNFASLKTIKHSFYDLMFLKRSILKTKRPNYNINPTLTSDQISQYSLIRFRGGASSWRNFQVHFRNHLNLVNCSLDSPLTHEFDTNLLEGEDDYYIRVKRIRFKPGYPRLWRESRSDFNKLFNLNFRYQHRLTQHLVIYSRRASALKSKFVDLRLKTFLLRVWWVFDPITSLELINSSLVFLNGNVVRNPNKLLFRGDLIQLVVHLKYYVLHKWLLNWYYYKSNRKARLAKTKFKRVQQAQMKQRSFLLPNWLLNVRLSDLEVPRFVEADFFSLSAILLYTPQYSSDYQLLDTLDSRFEIYSMYNWKYIT